MGSKLRSIFYLTRSFQCTSPLIDRNFLPSFHLLLFNPFFTSYEAICNSEPKTETPFRSHENSVPAHTTIAQLAISKISHVWKEKTDAFPTGASLQWMIRSGLDLSPETLRRFLRALELQPEDFLEILTGFGDDLNLSQVTYLWKLFRWCELQRGDFHHLPRSYEIMVSHLASAQMLDEAKSLVSYMVKNTILLSDCSALFSNLIQAHAEACEVDGAMSLFDQARDMGLILSGPCYCSLLNSLIKIPNAKLAVRVYGDMIDAGLGSFSENFMLDLVALRLANGGKLLEAIKLIRVLKKFGIEPGQEAVLAIAEGFCRKKDFGDMINFLEEQGVIPKTEICNKMVNSLCSNLGSEQAWLFVQKMEKLGFKPDASTFGNLICQSCGDGNVSDAFIYLSECFSRKLMPKVYFYNSIIGSVFRKGMYRHVSYVFDDMLERGLKPDIYTFRILLVGYCKYRKLDEVEKVIKEINNSDVISLEKGGCFFTKAMLTLGLGHLGVKLRRDNSIGFQKAEFFDNLGNGLYLNMDIDEFESFLDGVLDLAMVPNFNLAVNRELKTGNVKNALEIRYEAMQLGKDLSLDVYEKLLKCLCANVEYLKDAMRIIDEMPELCHNLGSKTFNLVIRFFSENKMAPKAHSLLEKLVSEEMLIDRESYSSLLLGFCEERDIHGFKKSLDLAQSGHWSPEKKDFEVIFGFLCNFGAIRETLELLDSIERYFPMSFNDAYKVLVKMFSSTGYTDFACAVVEAILNKGLVLDNLSLLYLIKGFIKEQKPAEALGLFEIWLERNKTLDDGTFKSVLPLIVKFDCVEKALCLVQPTQETVPISLMEFCLRGKMKEANSFFQVMVSKNLHFDATCLNALLRGHSRENNFRIILEILCHMLRKGACISISGYRALISQMFATKNFEKAFNLSELIQGENKPSEIIFTNILIFYLFHMGSESLVERVLSEMQHRRVDPDNMTYDFLLYGYYKCGNMPKLVEALDSSISKGFEPSNRSLRIAMNHFCTRGSLDKAIELFNLMKFNKWKYGSSIVNTLGLYLISSGMYSEAKDICENAPENLHFDPLIRQFCFKGEIKTAISWVNKMLKNGNMPCETTYSGVINLLCHRREIEAALDFLIEMEYRQLRPSKKSCETLIQVLCDLGRLHDAKLVLEVMVQVGTVPSCEMYNLVLEKYCEVKHLEKAAEITREMQKAGYKPKFDMQWSIISELCSFGDKSGTDCKPILSRILSSSGGALLKKLKR